MKNHVGESLRDSLRCYTSLVETRLRGLSSVKIRVVRVSAHLLILALAAYEVLLRYRGSDCG